MTYIDPSSSGNLARMLAPLFILISFAGTFARHWIRDKVRRLFGSKSKDEGKRS